MNQIKSNQINSGTTMLGPLERYGAGPGKKMRKREGGRVTQLLGVSASEHGVPYPNDD